MKQEMKKKENRFPFYKLTNVELVIRTLVVNVVVSKIESPPMRSLYTNFPPVKSKDEHQITLFQTKRHLFTICPAAIEGFPF